MMSPLFSLSFTQTRFFSPLIHDYLLGKGDANPLYAYPVSSDLDIKRIISQRNQFPYFREDLHRILERQHATDAHHSDLLRANLASILSPNTFSICTAHQPHIAMGPMYVIYKTIHTIQWARYLSQQYPEYRFVPIFFIGSEDADKGELLTVHVNNKPLRYQTWQKGAVGRMKTQEWKYFKENVHMILPPSPHKQGVMELLQQAYNLSTMTTSFRYLLSSLFAQEGLLILDVDDVELKKTCLPLFIQEIEENKTISALQKTSLYIKEKYNSYQLQATDSNFFHLEDGIRQKVSRIGDRYVHPAFSEPISQQQYISFISQRPETVSPNALLRTLLQEYLLPNVAFVGGTGEVSYWLQLKGAFETSNVHYPYLGVRHSTTLVEDTTHELLRQMGISFQDLVNFYPFAWEKLLDKSHLNNPIIATQKTQALQKIAILHQEMRKQGVADERQLEAFEQKIHHFYRQIEHRYLRQLKSQQQLDKIAYIYASLFPFGKLQERTYSWLDAYNRFGKGLVKDLLMKDGQSPSVPVFSFVGNI